MAKLAQSLPLERRIAELIGLPAIENDLLRFLAMVVVAWADGVIQHSELEAIREEARASKLRGDLRDHVEGLLARSPGPYLEHRVINLIKLAQGDMLPDEAKRFSRELARCAEAVDHKSWNILRRLFDGQSKTTEGIRRMRDALAERFEPATADVLERVMTAPRIVKPHGKKSGALSLPAGPAIVPKLVTAMHLDGEYFTQVRALAFPAIKGHPAAAIACIEPFHFGAGLDEKRVTAVFRDLADRPEIERWVQLHRLTSSLGKPPGVPLVADLQARVAERVEGPLHTVSLAEMSDLEDTLALHHGWAGWVSGTFRELVVDATEVRREVPPGNFTCPRDSLKKARVLSQPIEHVSGLWFRVLELESDIGERLAVATPHPEPGKPVTEDFVRWLCHFLPLLQDPLSTPLFGYDLQKEKVVRPPQPDWMPDAPEHEHPAPTAGGATWRMALRSGFPAESADLPPEPLPVGTALVVTPWLWLRVAWALGVDPDQPGA